MLPLAIVSKMDTRQNDAMSQRPPDPSSSEPHLFRTLREDVGQVLHDVQQRGVRRSIGRTLDEIEQFYLSEATRRHLATLPTFSRWAHRFGRLAKSLLMKLTPARRVLLALAVLLLLLGVQRFDAGNVHISLNWRVVGDLLLVVVLMLELKDKLIARDELQAGRAVQLALMPRQKPQIAGWDVWVYTEPANDVGGDLVDHVAIDETRHGVVLADVAGKALPAALLAVKLQATLRALIPQCATLSELGAGINRILERDGLTNRFATLVYFVLTAGSGTVRFLNAGHPPPLLIRKGRIEELPRGSMALGIMPDAQFAEQQIDLEPGDVLIAYSDGVTEAENGGGEFYGDSRLRTAIGSVTGQAASGIGTGILRALSWFVDDAAPHDDVSLVVMKRL